MYESEIDEVNVPTQVPRHARKLTTALVENKAAALRRQNTQLRKMMCEPDGLVEVNESIDSVGFDDDDLIAI